MSCYGAEPETVPSMSLQAMYQDWDDTLCRHDRAAGQDTLQKPVSTEGQTKGVTDSVLSSKLPGMLGRTREGYIFCFSGKDFMKCRVNIVIVSVNRSRVYFQCYFFDDFSAFRSKYLPTF